MDLSLTLAPAQIPRNKSWWASDAMRPAGATGPNVNVRDVESDVELVARIVAGDQRAFAEIVRRHAGRLKALALGFSLALLAHSVPWLAGIIMDRILVVLNGMPSIGWAMPWSM